MKTATFYILNESNDILTLACELVIKQWQSNKKVIILCKDQNQALDIDELLWSQEPTRFIPHNLCGEHANCPVEINWVGSNKTCSGNLCVNLSEEMIENSQSFNKIIDFVPFSEKLKEKARKRYSLLRNLHWQMQTVSC